MITWTQTILVGADTVVFADDIHRNFLQVWKLSRPLADPERMDIWEILEIDAPITEFAHVNLSIKAPILIREILATVRPHIMWAQTSRASNLTDWEIFRPQNERDLAKILQLHEAMQFQIREGDPQDSYRQRLPLSYMTEFSYRVSFRDLIRLAGLIRELLYVVADETISEMMMAFSYALMNIIQQTVRDLKIVSGIDANESAVTKSLFGKFKPFALFEREGLEVGIQGGILTVDLTMSWALRAQLVRHRNLTIQDQLSHMLRGDPALCARALSERLGVKVSAPLEVWRGILSSRQCWIAQTDLWQPLINLVTPFMESVGFERSLPCSNGTCPYVGDVQLRLEGKDPLPPCPREFNLSKRTQDGTIVNARTIQVMTDYVANTKRPGKFWLNEINRIAIGEET